MEDGKPSSHPPMVGGEDEMDVGDCSEEGEEEDEEEEEIEMGSSPLEDHGSLMMALASSNVLPYEGLASPLRLATSGGKPLGLRRGPGRPPRKDTPPHSTRPKKPLGLKLKRWKGSVYMQSDKSPRHSMDGDTMDGVDVSPAHSSEPSTPALSSDDKHDKFAPPSYTSDEPPYFQETWPGKVCALCNLSERTQLGQGEMIKVTCPDGFTPQKKNVDPGIMSPPNDPDDSSLGADKSPRCSTTPALSYRRQKSWSKCRNPSINGQEPLDELAIIGYTEEPDVTNLFEHSNDQWVVYVHESCALWSLGISRPSDSGFQAIGPIVLNASVKKCASCNKMGASTACTFSGCTKYFHLPCAAAVGCFQDAKSYALVCNIHLHHVPLMANLRDVTCMSCYSLGDVSNLVMCSMCGNNYHGSCVGLALLPGSRAGWQCSDCRMCQVCRQPEDSKIMVCETCDKAYHPHCLRPIVTTVPKYGWKCKCCRLCSDCGSRTPGAGQSSRWHAHYTVCDSCYQQRNKGFSCPLCRRAYRAAAYREMVQCSKCKKFVHGTCDSEADLATYQLKKETTPEYEYVCPNCKSGIQNALKRKDSTEDFCMDSNMSASQESLLLDEFDFDCDKDGYSIGIGLGKGKPFSASKIAKKKLGLGTGLPGRPGKGLGKVSGISLSVMSSYQKKHQRCNEFGRKRIPKAKMRGIFGVPGLGLQRPQADTTQSKSDEEPGGENRLVLCSAKDKFVLTQDMCVMCGALGTDQEGCLIACAQCGQCYHPYCVSVKVTKVILQKGWRCLDCTVCEGCGQKNDEARLILCDDCDISYHIYCMDPPLSYVPRGTWKCKWCAQCLTCGANNPGFNCTWLRNYTECGPCASRISCPSCAQGYGDGELIIKCIQCERWLHCACDQIRDESEAEFCAEEGYSCILCRPRDVKPPHLLPGVFQSKPRPPSPARSPDYTKVMDKDDFYVVDGVKLSESGLHQIRALTIEQQVQPRKKRSGPRREIARPPTFTDKEAGILAAIESVVAGGDDADEDSTIKEEVSRYKEGMEVTPRPDGRAPEPPEGFSVYTTESGVMVLRRKRQRNLQRLGIGGFNARLRQTRCRDKEEESGVGEGAPATTPTTPGGSDSATTPTTPGAPVTGGAEDKPRRKPQRRKPKSKLVENYPSYLQEAFFGRDLLDTSKETSQDLPSSSDESEDGTSRVSQDKTITLSQDELKVIEQMKIKQEKEIDQKKSEESGKSPIKQEEDDGSDSEALKDILRLPDNLLDTELVNTIMTEGDGDIKSEDALMADTSLADDSDLNRSSSTPPKDELSDILGPHFNLESMVRETGLPNMDCKDVEEIFKGVLTDESQESQESPGVFPMTTGGVSGGVHGQSGPPIMSPSHSVIQTGLGLSRQPGSNLPSVHSNLPSPITFPAASPYHSEYSNSPQFSPAFSEPPSPWADDGEGNGGPHSHYNQRNTLKMEADETLGNNATISCVLYANMNHPEWKKEYPTWSERSKQILKKWRALPSEKKAPYLQQARDNRANLRMKKAQQEQDKLQQQQKNCREAEQERAWKQMQALRQQQAAQQQQVMQDQRAQAARSVHRQLDGGVLQMGSEPQSHLTSQLQVSTVQDTGSLPSMTSPGGVRTPQQFPSPVGLKAQHIGSPVGMPNYPRSGTPALPIRGVVNTPTSQDPFAPPRQMQPIVHPAGVQGQEMNRQLRDLLQRQHIKNKMESEQMIQQRAWPLQEDQGLGTSTSDASGGLSLLPPVSQAQNTINFEPNTSVPAAANNPTFRHPLPPSLARPTRLPLQQGQMIIRGQRMPPFSDPRMQGVDPRVRLLLQQQQQQQQQRPGFSPGNQMVARLAGPRNPLDPYDHLVQQRPEFQEGPGGNIVRQIPSSLCNDPSRIQSGVQNSSLDQQRIAVASGGDSREEIPESVTAELEKLEQEEGSTIPEVENVGAILGDLVEDDDELLAEMGADFNILEYADPELDTVTGGEKTNILDVDLEEEETKKDNSSINNRSEKKEDVTPGQDSTKSTPADNATNNSSIDKPLNNAPQETTTSSTNQSSLPLMTMSSSNNVAPPMSQPQTSIVGTVLTQSSGGIVATVSYPATFPVANQPLPRIQHIGQVAVQQQQRLQQLQRLSGGSRVVSVGPGGQILPPQQAQQPGQQGLVNSSPGLIPTTNNLMSPTGTARLAPPPPPYPGPPPPYPGPIQQEQPLLLEDLLEQEKREQEKQASVEPTPATALLSDADFERLRADVLGTPQGGVVASPPHGLPAQGILPAPGLVGQPPALRPQFVPRPATQQPQWQQSQPNIVRTPVLQQDTTLRVPLFNAPVLPPPTPPPDNITTEQDKQQQLHYETWLNNQNHIVTQQLKYYETEVQKLRKIRKSLNSRQRQLRKNGNELAENDAMELQRVTAEQAVLQKQLESSRKQSRQHGVLIQEYRNKQQANKVVRPGVLSTSLHSSPSGSSPQSPLLTSPSPGPLSVSQQQSPRIGTPHSQGDDNPFSPGTPGTSDILRSLPSPSRLTSPSPRAITSPRAPNPPPPSSTPRPNVGSPGAFSVQDQSIRSLGMPPRFVRSPESGGLRPRAVGLPLQVPGPTASPVVYQGPRNVAFSSNPQPIMTAINDNKMVRLGGLTPQQQQMLLRQQLHQQRQVLLQQQQELTQEAGGLRQIAQQRLEQQQQQQQGEGPTPQQRQIQLVHQKQALLQQQELLQQQLNEPNLSPQQRQQIMQQRQALIHQSTEIAVQEKAIRLLLQNQEGIEGGNINRQQFQMLQHRQQQLAQQTRQQLILSQQGKTGQFRQMIQQQQGPQQQSPSRSPMGQFSQTSPMPSPIVQHFTGTPTSPMPPQSPIQQQFPGNSPMHPQSPMVNQTQSNSPILPQSPINVQQFNQPNSSPMHPQSPMIQYSNQTPNSPMPPHSPRVQQQFSNQTPSSPITPQSPMVQNQNYQHQVTTPPMQSYNQPPNSPMQSPRMQPQYGQPPSSPITPQSPLVQQNQFVHRPNSPMPPKSPMPPMGSPMPMRRPSSTGGSIASSPQIPDRPQSVENPATPRTPQDYEGGGGGGNPHNPMNPIPFPPGFGRFGYIKLGLRGGSPMWGSDRIPPRKPTVPKVSRDGGGSSKSETPLAGISTLKTGSLVSLDYNEFEDDSSRNSAVTPPAKMLQKKQQIIETHEQPSKPSDDSEFTVFDDIVLVESCKGETNLEVEELQSSLQSNVMSMPMVLDSVPIPIINLGSGNVEGQLLEECLVSGTDLVVLDVGEQSESEGCLLEMVEKDHMDSGGQDLLNLEDELTERESKGDESDVMELMEESSSPPSGRKRMVGKVLPGETLRKVQEKRDSTTDTPESPYQDESHADPLSETDNETISTTFENIEKSDTVSTTTPEGVQVKEEIRTKMEETKVNFPVIASGVPPSSMHQANIGIPGLTRQTMSYPTFSRNPAFPRHVLPIIKSDGRPVFAVQATVANLVQDAVNAAKLAAEKKSLNQGVPLSSGVVIPNILQTPSTIASLGVVSTTCSTLIGPPRMSVPFSSSGRVTVTNAPTGTHYMPILSQSDKLSGLLKIESLKVINQKIDLSDKSGEKTAEKQMPKITSAMLITSHPSSESASTSDLIFQRRYFEDKFKSDIKLTPTKSEDRLTPQIPTPTKFHNYSKMLVKSSNERQPSPSRSHSLEIDSESRRSELIQRSEGPENLSTQNSIIMKHFSNESVRHAGVICNKRSSIDLTSSTSSSSNTSSVITQVSVISDNKTTSSVQDNLFKSENTPTSEESGSIGSSILEAQLTATSNKDDLLPRTSSAASPSKTLFSFLDNVGPPNKDSKPQQNKEPQSVSVNMSKILLPFDEQTIHTEGMTLYRSSENITASSNMPHMFKSTQSMSEIKLPTSVSEYKNIQEESRVISQPTMYSQAVRRIGNIYVHSQNIKSESNLSQSDLQKGKDDTSEQKPTQRNVSVLYSTEQPFQNQSKDCETVVTKTDLSRTSSMTDLLKPGQKRESVFERQISTESREVEKINLERQICSSKSMPSRLGELISGSASVQAHIERRISIAGQTDLMVNRARFFQKEEPQNTENLQQRTVSSSESSTSVVFSSGSAQRENITETNTTSSQFIPLSSMLTPKTEPEEKLIRISSHSVPRISEESQNVLLKQLLQNTACATTAVTPTTPVNTLTIPPPLPVVEAQRPAVTITNTAVTQTMETVKVVQSPVTVQMSSVPVPKVATPPTPQSIVATATIKTPQESPQPEVRRMSTGTPTSAGTPTSTLDELLSPTSSCSMPQTSPVVIKREPMLMPSQIKREPMPHQTTSAQPMVMTSPITQKSPVMVEVKKEIISSDEMISPSLRHQESSDVQMSGGSLEQNLNMPLDPQDIKKIKRRQYQQKRRQSQGKDAIGGTPKKRPRKNSKVEEDYDSFIDALMVQLRQTPAMSILEPSLSRNYTVCPIFGSGDLSKVSCNTRLGDLKGTYGSATLSTESDYYNTQPYGDLLPVPPQSTPSTQRGFYNEEFAPLKLDTFKDELDERKLEFNRDRDNDTPDTIVSSSSPECIVPEIPIKYPGLRLIEDDDSDEDTMLRKRGSPVIPLFAPQAVKPKTSRFLNEMDKENQYGEHALIKTRISPSIPLKDSGNVTVTLTLTSAAADDVLGVLRNLANVLRIPAPTTFHITERTATPPSHKLGLYRCKGKDGKEGAPIDIQSILNGAAKFCRHCDVVILNNLIKKKATEMPFLAREEGSEELYFCSSACYMQLALLHHPPSISKDKAAAIVDHLSQNDPSPPKKTRLSSASETAGEIKKSVKLNLKPENFVSLKMDVAEVKSSAILSSEDKDPFKKEEFVELKKPRVKGIKYRVFNGNAVPPPASKHKKASDKEMTDMLFRMGITVTPQKMPDDTRVCLFCHQVGDGVADGPARLLNYDVDKWVHLNCALWSDEVYETVNGALMNVETALQQSLTAGCTLCHRTGATLKCYKMRCLAVYHLSCAVKDECIFYKNKTLYCNLHVPKNEKDNELTTLSVFRRVYVNRDENRQVASVMHHTEHNHLLRVGTLIFLNVGQLLPHQLAAFHTPNYIYPIGYKIIRFYWSMRVCNKRCRYVCSIHEANGRPEFRVLIQEQAQDDIELRDLSPRAVWTRILEPLSALRKANDNVLVFPRFVSGEDLFGLTEPAIVKVLESLPGVETLTDYRFKYGRNPLLELPLAINPSGCARCESKPKGQGQWKRAHTQRTGSASRPNFTPSVGFAGDAVCPYSKQFVHSKSSQYKKMKQEWRNNVYLARSKIQGLGLYAARDLEKHTMVIEYIGEIIRTELAESREKQYEAKNRGIYMFRLDEERVVDATLSGGLARYINHSCNPNCVAETVEVERDQRIIIFAKRRISRGEELAYDYKFDIEDDQHKIPCMCGAPNCRKWMN